MCFFLRGEFERERDREKEKRETERENNEMIYASTGVARGRKKMRVAVDKSIV